MPQKTKYPKNSKCHVSRPHMKNIRKQTIAKIKEILRVLFLKFQKLKNYPKNTQKPKSQKIKKSCKETSNEKCPENKLELEI